MAASDGALGGDGRRYEVRGVRRLIVERHVLPGIERSAQRRTPPARGGEDLRPLVPDVAAFVAGLDHGLERHPVRGRAGLDALGMADGPAAELQHDVLTEIGQELMHLTGVNASRGDGHELAKSCPVLIEEDSVLEIAVCEAISTIGVYALDNARVSLQLSHDRPRVDVVDAGHAHPLGDNAKGNAMSLLTGIG